MSELMRLYKAEECAKDGYPPEWHERVKHEVRVLSGDRCVRCLHPYSSGEGEWSACDKRCTHTGPVRYGPAGMEFDAGDKPAGLLSGFALGIPVEARWRILTVHHLNGNKADLRWWNLTPLCQRCHLQVQGKVQMARVWPWGHSTWFEPYVAAYYALVYLGEELTREETMQRLDELLALERAA